MKTTKLVLGILGIIFSVVIMFQSCAASVVNALDDNGDIGGAAGYLVAILLIAGSIVMIATRSNAGKGGSVAGLIILALGGMIAVSNAAVYKDLTVWGILCFICAAINLLSLFFEEETRKEQRGGMTEMKNKFVKAFCLILLCAVLSSCSISSLSSIADIDKPSKIGNITKEQPAETASSGEPKTTGASNPSKAQNTTAAPGTAEAPKTTEVPKTAEAPKTTEVPKTVEAPEKDLYQVGDIVEVKGLKIIYTASGEYTSSNSLIQPNSGNKYIYLEFYAEYSGSGSTNISYFDFEGYADGYAVDQKYTFDNTLSGDLSAGRWTLGRIYFEVPQNAESIEAEFEYDMWNSKKLKFAYEGKKDAGFVPEAKTAPSKDAFKPGDIIDAGKFKISYLGCDYFKSDNMFIQPDEGNTFIFLELEFENTSDSDRTVSSLLFECYADGKNCSSTSIRNDDLSASLSPGRKAKGTVAFQIPKDAVTVEIEYRDSLFTDRTVIFSFEK